MRRGRESKKGVAEKPGPVTEPYPVRFGLAKLVRDPDRSQGWLLTVDDIAQSYVDLDDPTHLEFDYVRRIGDVIDCMRETGTPMDVLHIGGGACTLPRYIAATRPKSRQLVFDADEKLIELARKYLNLSAVPGLRVRITDGREGTRTRRDNSADLIVLDAFERAAIPSGLATLEFMQDLARALRPSGSLVINISDGPGLLFTRRLVTTVFSVFPQVLMVADPGVLRGRRFGNLVLVASQLELPVEEIARRGASAAFAARCLTSPELRGFAGSAKALTDAQSMPSPAPPAQVFGLRS